MTGRGDDVGGNGSGRPRITVVIPCLNEEQGLPWVLTQIPDEVHEVLVLDNCSTDRTVEVAADAGGRVRVVRHPTNLGYGGSYIRGLPMATGDVLVTSDGDGTYPVKDCLRLVDALLEGGYDFLSCSRFPLHDRSNMSGRNRFGNWLLNTMFNVSYGLHLKDGQTGMWVFRKSILEHLDLTSTGMAFSHEIKIEAFTNPKIRAGEVPIPYAERIGTSKLYPIRDGFRMMGFLVRRRLRDRRSERPAEERPAEARPEAPMPAGVAHVEARERQVDPSSR